MPLPRTSHGGRLLHGAMGIMITAGVRQTKEMIYLRDPVRARDKPGQDMYHAAQVVDWPINRAIQTFFISQSLQLSILAAYPEQVISLGSAKYMDSFVAFGGFNPNNGGLSKGLY